MSDIERHRGLLKLSGSEQGWEDLNHLFTSVIYAKSSGHDVEVDQLWLSTAEPLTISFSDAPGDSIVANVLDGPAAQAVAEMEIDEMLGDSPTSDQAHIRDGLGLAQGARLEDGEKAVLRDVFAETFRRMGGVAIVSSQTPEGLAVARGFYEDTRSLGR